MSRVVVNEIVSQSGLPIQIGKASISELVEIKGEHPVAVDQGGTGSRNAETARSNLGLGSAATRDVGTGEGMIPTTDLTVSAQDTNIVRTVGSGGDHQTINEALEYLTRRYYAHYVAGENITAVVQLLDGFVMEEQVLVNQLDLGWIRLESLSESENVEFIQGIDQGAQIPNYEREEISRIELQNYPIEIQGNYFKMTTAGGAEHYLYFNTTSEFYNPATEEGVTGTGHEIVVDPSDSQEDVATKVRTTVDGISGFTAVRNGTQVEITYDVEGSAGFESVEGRIIDTNIITSGSDGGGGGDPANQVVNINIIDYTYEDITEEFNASTLNGQYIEIEDGSENQFYFWFNVSGGSSDPTISGKTGYEITVLPEDDYTQAAQKLLAVIDGRPGFDVTRSSGVLTVANATWGAVEAISHVGGDLSTSVIQEGQDEGFLPRIYIPGHEFTSEQRIIIRNHVGGAEEVNYNGTWFVTNPTDDYIQLDFSYNPEAVYSDLKAGSGTTGQVVEPGIVTVSREALTRNWEYFYYPAFGVARGTLPLIATIFEMDESGDDPGYASYRDGLCATDQGVINILPYCGFRNAHGSNIYGTRNSMINCNDAIADGAGRHGVWAYSGTIINARRVDASNCGLGGASEDTGNGFDSLGRPVGSGLFSTRGSIINADGCTVSGCQGDNILALGGIINLTSHVKEDDYVSESPVNGGVINNIRGEIYRKDPVTSYGLVWDSGKDQRFRIESSKGLVARAANAAGNGLWSPDNDFDRIYPWSEIKRCNLSDAGSVNAYFGEFGYSDNGSNGQVMVEIPKFYYKASKSGNLFTWEIAKERLNGFKVHPAFIRDGVEKDVIYIGAYEGSVDAGTLRSISGVQPSSDTQLPGAATIGDFRTYAQARGSGWEQRDYLTTSALQLLYMIEYGSFDSQTTIGRGVSDKTSGSDNESENTGATSVLGNKSGMANGTNGLVSISYRGVENLWSNIWEWLDGINIRDYSAWIADHDFADATYTSPYVEYPVSLPTSNNSYIKNLGFDSSMDYILLPSEVGGSLIRYFYDNYWVNPGDRVVRAGGYWNSDDRGGLFALNLNYEFSSSNRRVGGRLLYLG